MPTGPKGQKRPADVIGMSVKVMRIATGEEEEELDRAKSAAAELGARGGKTPRGVLGGRGRGIKGAVSRPARWPIEVASRTHPAQARPALPRGDRPAAVVAGSPVGLIQHSAFAALFSAKLAALPSQHCDEQKPDQQPNRYHHYGC
jgi:hypothetical protein